MNTNPQATTVLCYGDSNTWGQKPDRSGRYAADMRWTGVLQQSLGDSYYVIEEGLSSRTTDLDYQEKAGRNGKTYLQPCLESHNPLDVVIVMLGTNDLKIEFDRSAAEIADALKGLVEVISSFATNKIGEKPQIILVNPIAVEVTGEMFKTMYADDYNQDSADKSKQLGGLIEQVAKQTGCIYVDARTVARPFDDGIHFTADSHPALGELLAQTVKGLAK